MKHTITIIVEGGVIQDILDIPGDVIVAVQDYDVEGMGDADVSVDEYDDEYVSSSYQTRGGEV